MQRLVCDVKFFSIQQVKFGSPDYVDRDINEAMEDFVQRIECYKASYMPIDDEKDRYGPMMLFLFENGVNVGQNSPLSPNF